MCKNGVEDLYNYEATREANLDGVEAEDKKLDITIEQKQQELTQHELLKPRKSSTATRGTEKFKDAMAEWLKKKRLLETELKALQEKHPVNKLKVIPIYSLHAC